MYLKSKCQNLEIRKDYLFLVFSCLDRGEYFKPNASTNGRSLISGHFVSPIFLILGKSIFKWYEKFGVKTFFLIFVYSYDLLRLARFIYETRNSVKKKVFGYEIV